MPEPIPADRDPAEGPRDEAPASKTPRAAADSRLGPGGDPAEGKPWPATDPTDDRRPS